MTPDDLKTLKKVLSEKERQWIGELYNYVDGDVSKFIVSPTLYAMGDKLHLSKDEVYRYSVSLGNRGLLKVEPVFGREIAAIKLTTDGVDFVILTR